MANKGDKRIIPLTMVFTPVQHFQLKKVAELHNRSMNDEVIYLVEEVARDMLLDLNWNDDELKKNIEKAASKLGISETEYVKNEKKEYVKRREIQAGVYYHDGPIITWEEIIREQLLDIVLRSDKEIQEGFIEIAKSIQTYRKTPFPLGDKNAPLQVNEPAPSYAVEPPPLVKSETIDSVIFLDWGVMEIPLLGTTAVGHPIDFGDLDPDPPTRKWSASLIKGNPADYYCVAIRGQSMTEADIKDGDHALLRHAQKPKQGEIMLVRHDNSSTLKRIRIVEGKNGQEEVYICWEDGSKHRVKLDGDEIQGLLIAIERKSGKR